jgi:putative phosphoesterase
MTKLAIISDIHGNLAAFEATLKDIAKHGIQDIVCLGDVANFGPQPKETLLRIQELNCPIVMGNADRELLEPPQTETLTEETNWFADVTNWCADQLDELDKRFIRTFKSTLTITIDGLNLLAYHGSPKSYNDLITAITSDETLHAFFEGTPADIYAGGHTHEQFIRPYGAARIMNPGSVGLSFILKGQKGVNLCVAEYAILEVMEDQPNVTFRRIRYDSKALEKAAHKSGMPHANHWLGWF